jgi:hypothetical protein
MHVQPEAPRRYVDLAEGGVRNAVAERRGQQGLPSGCDFPA